jgi:hypothetical protein
MPDADATPDPEALAAVRLLLARGQPGQAMEAGMAAARLAGVIEWPTAKPARKPKGK